MSTRSKTEERLGLLGDRLPLPALVAIAVFLGVWQAVATQYDPSVFPGLGLLAHDIVLVVTSQGQFDFLANVVPTVVRIGVGFVLSMIIGVALGIAMGTSESFEDYLTAPVLAIMTFPAVVWAFIGILWFGITDYVVHVFVITLVVTPSVTVNVWKGAEAVDAELLEMAETFETSWQSQWRNIHIPHLQPFIFSSARLAFALSWKIALVSEVFGATSGVGYAVSYYYQTLHADMIIAWAFPVMVVMFLVERVFRRLEERSFQWRPELEASVGEAAE